MSDSEDEKLSYDSARGTFYRNGDKEILNLKEIISVKYNGLRDLISERDRRYEERFIERDRRYGERFGAQEQAVLKAEEAQKQYNHSHNDLARKMDDQYRHMMPRLECEKAFGSYETRLSEIKDSVNVARVELMREITGLRESRSNIEGRSGGLGAGWAYLLGVMVVISTVISIVGFIKT